MDYFKSKFANIFSH